MANVSVIVPVYNVKKELRNCLNSLVNQTLKDIEIICVDDFSQDGSREILKEYAEKDNRIILVLHEKNLGTSQARKDGVSVSKGKYIMFADGDDFFELNACEAAYNAIEEKKTDILNFGVNIVNRGGFSEGRIKSNQKMVEPYLENIYGEDLIRCCWEDKKFSFTLWNKIFSGDICRRAFSCVEDGNFPKAQDLYAFFIIAYFSKSFSGIEDKLYNYNFGIGVTGGQYLSMEKFDSLLSEYNIYKAIERFLSAQSNLDEYQDIVNIIYQHFLGECVGKWFDFLRPELFSEGFTKLVDVWGLEEVICNLAERRWFSRCSVAEKIVDFDYFRHIKRDAGKKLTIAAYYHSIYNGGAQRVVATLCNMWSSLKNEDGEELYNVVLITDGEPNRHEYPLNSNVKRAFLPSHLECVKEKYRARYEAWEDILERFDVDIVVNSMWNSPCALWDMMCVKGFKTKPAYIMHCHSFCCLPYQYPSESALTLTYIYRICDGVVTLSKCDERIVSAFSEYTKCIANPITFSETLPAAADVSKEENALVWVGRISVEKQPFDAVTMMSYVIKEIPNAKLYMVGAGESEMFKHLQDSIYESDLQNNVILTGFTKDVETYYQKANICVSTSEYEGFSLTFCEAMSHELPIVSYDMPWLIFMQDGRGIIPVQQKRVDILAREVVRLLKDPNEITRLGKEGKQQIEDMKKINIAEEWKLFFDGIGTGVRLLELPAGERTAYEFISLYQQIGKNKLRASMQKQINELAAKRENVRREKNEIYAKLKITYDEKFERGLEIKALKKENAKLKKQIKSLRRSETFKLGKIIMFLPVRLKRLAKKLLKR